MPCVTQLDTPSGGCRIRGHRLESGDRPDTSGGQAVAGFCWLAAARRGEVHGAREKPVLMQTFGLTIGSLEWPEDLASMICAFPVGHTLAYVRQGRRRAPAARSGRIAGLSRGLPHAVGSTCRAVRGMSGHSLHVAGEAWFSLSCKRREDRLNLHIWGSCSQAALIRSSDAGL